MKKSEFTVFKFLMILTATFLPLKGFSDPNCAHHQGGIAPPNGGVIEHGHNTTLMVELLAIENFLQVFFFDHEMNPVSPKEISLVSSLEFSKRFGGKQSLTLEEKEKAFVANIDLPQDVPFYKVHLEITYKNQTDSLIFTVEPF